MPPNQHTIVNLSQPGQPLPAWIQSYTSEHRLTHAFKLTSDTYLIHLEPLDNSGECEIELVRRHDHDGMHFFHSDLLPEEARSLYDYIAILFVHMVHPPKDVIQ